jgi:hypothetical protein
MNKRHLLPKWAPPLWLFLGLIIGSCNNNSKRADNAYNCVPTQTYPGLPHMYVDTATSFMQERNYTNRFDGILASHLTSGKETDSMYYDTTAFLHMVDAFMDLPNADMLQVVIAMYNGAGPGKKYIPAGADSQLVLLYSPVDTKENRLGYFLLTDSASSFNILDNHIPDDVASDWINTYNSFADKWLNSFLDPHDNWNYKGWDSTGTLMNTQEVIYGLSEFVELRKEVAYQTSQNSLTIVGFKAFFANYPEQTKHGDGLISNRLKVNFEFVQQGGSDFYLENSPDFHCRNLQASYFKDTKTPYLGPKWAQKMGLDNGNLCPPTCNP